MFKSMIITLTLLASLSSQACVITVSRLKDTAKTSYMTDSRVFSKSLKTAFKTANCTIIERIMTSEEARQFRIKKLERQLSKLK